MEEKIKKILNYKVKPILKEHHGDIEFIKFEDNKIYVRLLGKCSGCPSARTTLEDVVLGCIKEEIEDIDDIILINEISEDILDMARKILKI